NAIVAAVKRELEARCFEYIHYELISVDDYKVIDKHEIAKAAYLFDPKYEPMKGVKLGYAWINDVKFEDTGCCVYDALAYLPRAPKIFKNRVKLLEFFQGCEYLDANLRNRDAKVLTVAHGVCAAWIQKLCEKYNITHYCIDIEGNFIYKHLADNKRDNYQPLYYYSHDGPIYLCADKKFIQKSQIRDQIVKEN